ncbi:glutamate--cysteine ligase [Anaplasma platys]|uniref:Glutamate--cysteine ligase n=1 Tax=Anaplasma platys TaxID=949 RepID=A0A858PZ54_9RICK|nr:glutamate--cysteine ligase [Anaplasma platys]QJC27847.1 glutamate--cysteine ligase [Anaplasma platys]
MLGFGILHDTFQRQLADVESWFEDKFAKYHAVFSSSVDLRSASYKVAPIDVNFFPAGYNNLGTVATKRAEGFLKKNLANYSRCSNALIIIEGHTRNKKYIDSVVVLQNLLINAGFATVIGGFNLANSNEVNASGGVVVNVLQLTSVDGQIRTSSGFIPDFIILNNDLTSGMPEILKGGVAQDILPSPYLGWFNRCKAEYFATYTRLVEEFCHEFRIDPWLISALFSHCDDANFTCKQSVERIANGVESLISDIKEKFLIYGISDVPYVFIKANNGTYGRGIVSVYSGEDVLQMNKRDRNKMRCVKERNPIDSVTLQEGIPTDETFVERVAEPLLYYFGKDLACYLYRYNSTRSKFENLNSPGVEFTDAEDKIPEAKKLVWYIVSKLGVLASAVEAAEITRLNS